MTLEGLKRGNEITKRLREISTYLDLVEDVRRTGNTDGFSIFHKAVLGGIIIPDNFVVAWLVTQE